MAKLSVCCGHQSKGGDLYPPYNIRPDKMRNRKLPFGSVASPRAPHFVQSPNSNDRQPSPSRGKSDSKSAKLVTAGLMSLLRAAYFAFA